MQYVTSINLLREFTNQLNQSLKEGSEEVYELYHTRYLLKSGEIPPNSISATIKHFDISNAKHYSEKKSFTLVQKAIGELTVITSLAVEGKPNKVESYPISSDEQSIRDNLKSFFQIQ